MSLPEPWSGYISPADCKTLLQGVQALGAGNVAHGIMRIHIPNLVAHSPVLYTHERVAGIPCENVNVVGVPGAPILYIMICGSANAPGTSSLDRTVTLSSTEIRAAVLLITDPSYYVSGVLCVCQEGAYLFSTFKSKRKEVAVAGGNTQLSTQAGFLADALRAAHATSTAFAKGIKQSYNVRFVRGSKMLQTGIDLRRRKDALSQGDDDASSVSSYSSASSSSSMYSAGSVTSQDRNIEASSLLSVGERGPPPPPLLAGSSATATRYLQPPTWALEEAISRCAPQLKQNEVEWFAKLFAWYHSILGSTPPPDKLSSDYRHYFEDSVRREEESNSRRLGGR